jgi:uncharacterized protein
MKYLTIFFALNLCVATLSAQSAPEVDNTSYKVVIQLTSGDTAVHRSTIKQIHNMLAGAPNSQIEVVCHNQGISFLVSAKTFQAQKIKELSSKGVVFAACENTMRDRNINREELLTEATTVPSGVIEVVKKQRKKWAYLKAG